MIPKYIRDARGQTALEFMMTYGWAILATMVAIAGLVYLMPKYNSALSEKCTFNPVTPCSGAEFSTNLKFVLSNNAGFTMYNVTANLTGSRCFTNSTILQGDQFTIICSNDGTLNISKDSRFKITINYKKSPSGFTQISSGDIYSKYDECTQNLRFRDINGTSALDNPNDKACCLNTNDCVSDGSCYTNLATVTGSSWSIATRTCGSVYPGNWT